MNQKELLLDTVDAILKHNEDGEDMVDLLLTTATLLNELRSGRFKNSSYTKTLIFERLTVRLDFAKEIRNA
jgi:hypothetical protein